MFTKKSFPFVAVAVLVIASLACSFGYNPQTGFTFQSGGAATQASAEVPSQPISCDLDKIGTWSETSSSSPYRIEVGGHGIEAFDFYPTKDVKAISYIVDTIEPNQTPAIWHGFGSAWEGQCLDYDYVADATRYAQARLDSGHSGLVIDMRDGKFSIVANVSNMTQAQIDALLALHKAAMDPTIK